MRTNDIITSPEQARQDARAKLMQAIADNDKASFDQAFNDMLEAIENDILQRHAEQMDEVREEADRSVLSQRGVRQLTSEEKRY